jgi:PQQ-dependent catabolism-associated CXXCW motif protein
MSRISLLSIETTRRGGGTAALYGVMIPQVLLTVFLALLAAAPVRAEDVAEPPDFRMDDYRSPTSPTLEGAKVVTVQEAYKLWHEGKSVFIDVMPRAVKPADLPMDTLWYDKPRETVPGAVWLPNVGYGKLPPAMDGYFRRNLEALTGGDKAKPLVFFCMADCWMSWNAAKRALAWGYTSVLWFPEGTDGWQAIGNDLVAATPVP